MELLFNKQTSCSECGCAVVVKEEVEVGYSGVIREHAHGGRWETRTFLCGYACQYSPNFSRNETTRPCQRTPEFEKREAERETLRGQIRELECKLRRL
jgi:hypothetical protein